MWLYPWRVFGNKISKCPSRNGFAFVVSTVACVLAYLAQQLCCLCQTQQHIWCFARLGALHGSTFGAFLQSTFVVQNFPNAINTAAFPDSMLKPGHRYQNICVWRFGTVPAHSRMRKLFMGLGVVLALAAAVTAYVRFANTGSRHQWRGPSYSKA